MVPQNQEAPMTPRHFALHLTLLAAAVVPAWPLAGRRRRTGFHLAVQRQGPHRLGLRPARQGQENKSGKGYQVENGVLFSHQEGRRQPLHREGVRRLRAALRVQADENANNGVGIRAPLVGDAAYVGMEIQVLDDNGKQYTQAPPVAVPRLHLRHGRRQARLLRSRPASGTPRKSSPTAARSP